MNWELFTRERRERRKFQPASRPKGAKITVASLAKAWHIDKVKLEEAILQIAKEQHEHTTSSQTQP